MNLDEVVALVGGALAVGAFLGAGVAYYAAEKINERKD